MIGLGSDKNTEILLFPFPFLILFILLSTTHTYLSPVQEHSASVIHANGQATKTKLFIPEVQKSAAGLDDGINIVHQLCGLQTHQTHVQWQRHHALNLGTSALREREREKEIFEDLKMKLLINANPSSVVQASTYCRSISLHSLNCWSRHLELLALEFSRESCCCWGLLAHRLLREKRIEPSST